MNTEKELPTRENETGRRKGSFLGKEWRKKQQKVSECMEYDGGRERQGMEADIEKQEGWQRRMATQREG